MARVKLIIVGGFLGAGKTTLLARASELLARRGKRVGLITNDQAANLVDTEVLSQTGQAVKEVSGACFCCAFNKLLYVCENLINSHQPDVILGEPVGSCTDLSATVMQPLKKYCADRFDLAPFSVLIDPDKLQECLDAQEATDPAGAIHYIYRKQIQEADLIVVNKIDELTPSRRAEIQAVLGREFPGLGVAWISAKTGEGVQAWLDQVLKGGPAGRGIVEIDYDTYAIGEAALGWLNAAVQITATGPADWQAFALDFLHTAQAKLAAASSEIAHFKLLLRAEGGRLQANLTSTQGHPVVLGGVTGDCRHATLIVNARVCTSPEELQAIIEASLQQAAGDNLTIHIAEISSFRPSRPKPVHRFDAVAEPGQEG